MTRPAPLAVLALCATITIMACGPSHSSELASIPGASDQRLDARLQALAEQLEAKRIELQIPGMSLVIVKDDQVIFRAGFGMAQRKGKVAATEDTLFAIGSNTKAFTSVLALIAQEEGKLSLSESPHKCLPWFKLKNAEDDARVTLRDLLTHTSGIIGTDLGWLTGKLTKREIIELVGRAERVAPVGKEFHYQNVMYLAAGECVANAMEGEYASLIKQRIFDRIGMKHANLSTRETLQRDTRAFGYGKVGENNSVKQVPMRDLDNIAPAGAINASARDMGQWLRFVLARGAVDGERLISESSFAQLVKPYISMAPNVGYGLGWSLGKWNEHQLVNHSGGIDGFVSLVALLPDENLGFALLTNIQNGEIHGFASDEIFSALTAPEDPVEVSAGHELRAEIGTYGIIGGLKIEVAIKKGTLTLKAPNQPVYPLKPLGKRRYRLGAPAPAGFVANFRPSSAHPGETELLLQQPQGDMVLRRLTPEMVAAALSVPPAPALAELIGSYRVTGKLVDVQIALREGRVAVMAPGQSPLILVQRKQEDEFGFEGAPESIYLSLVRDPSGSIVGAMLHQGESGIELQRRRTDEVNAPAITLDKLTDKIRLASKSASLGKIKSIVARHTIDFVNQGLGASEVRYARSDNRMASELTLKAFGREVGKMRNAFDGTRAIEALSFAPTGVPSPPALDAMRVASFFNPYRDWDKRFASVKLTGTSVVGTEECYVVVKTRASGVRYTEHYSKKSYWLLKRETLVPSERGEANTTTESFHDYRETQGLIVPFRVETQTKGLGKTISIVESVEINAPIPDQVFNASPG